MTVRPQFLKILVHLLNSTALVTFAQAQDLPDLASIQSGAASISQDGSRFVIQQADPTLHLDWNSFNIGDGKSVEFQQPSEASIALNSILSESPSQIDGALTANGKVFFSNPNGIVFGPNARVDVGSLLATTHALGETADGSFTLSASGGGSVINLGQLEGLNIALIGRDVRNDGQILSRNGTVNLFAGSDIEVAFDDAGLLHATIKADDVLGTVENRGVIDAGEGTVRLQASASEAVVASTIGGGAAGATQLVTQNGVLKLVRSTGKISGRTVSINAGQRGGVQIGNSISVANPNASGGVITITGKDVTLLSGALLDARGASGGGTVHVGGGWQGSGDMDQATFVTMEAGSRIDASALTRGNGGEIVLWSDIGNTEGRTSVSGTLAARGGVNGGDGGRIETSGHTLDYAGIAVDTTGDAMGQWLLDPTDVTIDDAAATTLGTQLNTSNVTVQADNNINFTFSNGIKKTSGAETKLTLTAGNTIGSSLASSSTIQHKIEGSAGSPLAIDINAGTRFNLYRVYINTEGADAAVTTQNFQAYNQNGVGWGLFAKDITINTDILGLNGTSMDSVNRGVLRASGDIDVTISGNMYLLYRATVNADGNLTIKLTGTNRTLNYLSLMNGSALKTTNGTLSITAPELRKTRLNSNPSSWGYALATELNSGNGDMSLNIQSFNTVDTSPNMVVKGAGTLTIAPLTTSFSSDFSWNAFYNTSTFFDFGGASFTGYTIGKPTNTSRVSIDAPISAVGPITIYGGIVDGSAALSTSDASTGVISIKAGTNNYGGTLTVANGGTLDLDFGTATQAIDFTKYVGAGTIKINSDGTVTQLNPIAVTSLAFKGSGNLSFTDPNNAISNFAAGNDDGSPVGNITLVNSGSFAVDEINPSGITSNGAVSLSTASGDLRVNRNIQGASITLNAGQNAAAGDAAGGNVVLNGNPNLTATNGSVRIFTGSLAGSAGVSDLIGLGSGNFRYYSDEVATNYSAALGQGSYAIYRERPTVVFSANDWSTVYDGQTKSGGNGFTVSGLVNSDALSAFGGALVYGGSSQGARDVGSYTITPSGFADSLGYAISYGSANLTIQLPEQPVQNVTPTPTLRAAPLANMDTAETLGIDVEGSVNAPQDQDVLELLAGQTTRDARTPSADLNSLLRSQAALGSLEAEDFATLFETYREVQLVIRNGFWRSAIELPETAPLGTAFSLERQSTRPVSISIGDRTFTPEQGEVLLLAFGENGWETADAEEETVLALAEQSEADAPLDAGPGSSDANDNTVSGTVGNQGNDKDVGNAGGGRGQGNPRGTDDAAPATPSPKPVAPEDDTVLALAEQPEDDVPLEPGPGSSDETDNTVSGTIGNQGNDKDVGNAGGGRSDENDRRDEEDPRSEDAPTKEPVVDRETPEEPRVIVRVPLEKAPETIILKTAETPEGIVVQNNDPVEVEKVIEMIETAEDEVLTDILVPGEFASVGAAADFQDNEERNIVARKLAEVAVEGTVFVYQISGDTFTHTDPTAQITISAELGNGQALPSWIRFDPVRMRLIGVRPDNAPDTLAITLIGRDQYGDSAETLVRIKLGE